MAEKFRKLAAESNKTLTIQAYDAQHAFANPTQQKSYNKADAKAANQLALSFLLEHLKGGMGK
jgi:carboxymethylenebutenolidase